MILPFSQQINGKPTYFAEKILNALNRNGLITKREYNDYSYLLNDSNKHHCDYRKPKLHTIRTDAKNRWNEGNKVHCVYNNRSKNQFQFAPTFECKSVQSIVIDTHQNVIIDRRLQLSVTKLETLAINDGFDTLHDFFAYFNTYYVGKIIHFTTLKY